MTLEALVDYNTDDYYQVSLRSGKEGLIEPYYYPVGGKNVLITSVTVPVMKNRQVIGVAGIDIDLTDIQNMVEAIKPYGEGVAGIFSSTGLIVAHPDPSRLGKQMRDTESDMVGEFLPTFAAAVTAGRELASTFFSPALNAQFKLEVVPTTVGGSTTPWAAAILVPESIVMAPVYRMVMVLIILGVAVLAILTVIIFFISRSITSPMKSMEDVFTVIGGGDFTPTLMARSKDEIGNISRSFNNTLGNIRGAIGIIKSKVNALTNTSYELSVNMDKTSKAVDNISTNFENIKGLEDTQKKEADEVDKALETIQNNINVLKKAVEDQTASVNTSSSAIEQMTANIHSVSQTLVENSKNVENLTEASELGRTAVQAVAQEIQEIAKDSEGLLEINSVMNKIASQTNLLSMNAAIEAAHAGEVGKGFAVVADEIRKLAESSSQQSKTTSAMLKKIKASIDSITKSSDEVLTRFGAIDTGVKTVSEHEMNIRHAMEEQEAGGKQILDAIGRLKEITVSVKKGSEDMSSSGGDLAKETNEFIKISNEALKGFNEIVNVALKEITVALSHVSEMNTENNKNFEDLKGETTKFKTTTGREKKKILAVDDDVVQLKVISSFLEEDYDIVGAKSCEAALKLLYQGLDPVFVLLDIVMPGADGWVTYTRIKGISDLHNVPIAFLTGSNDPADIKRAKDMGAVDYIKKPVSKDELLGKVKKALKAA
jgi:methyl-accepting chemotaxis protein